MKRQSRDVIIIVDRHGSVLGFRAVQRIFWQWLVKQQAELLSVAIRDPFH